MTAKPANAAKGGALKTLPQIVAPEPDVTGRIVVLDVASDLPFSVQRVYWIHGMRAGEQRGAHAHRELTQAIVAVSGRVRFELDDGTTRRAHLLDSPDRFLIVPPSSWRDFTALDDGTVLLVLASQPYRESDYIRDYAEFLAYRGVGQGGA
jgi:quercetin dioxygenase-like cupin family protein